MKTILSLFDYSGAWSQPYEDAGHNVIRIDTKHDAELLDARKLSCSYFVEELGIEYVDAILAALPCTEFTKSGAQYWPAKDADGRTALAVDLAYQVLRCVDFWKPDFWALENPVGRLPRLVPELGQYQLKFHPCDYAGYVRWTETAKRWDAILRDQPMEALRPKDIDFIWRHNLYTKETCLWGNFVAPEKRRIEPIRVCKQGSVIQRLGGKSDKTKAQRSLTPEGFATAFYLANDLTRARDLEYEDENPEHNHDGHHPRFVIAAASDCPECEYEKRTGAAAPVTHHCDDL